MTTTIAIAGKGGTGKTTLAALLIKYIVDHDLGTVLAIDADPSSNLNFALGLPLAETVGDIREEALNQVRAGSFPQGIAKQEYLDYKIYESLTESEKVDLLAMGRPEGPGCYCAANSMLRLCVDRLAQNYDFVVIDNEAGMEHLSRRTTRDVDILILVSDPTVRGIMAAARMKELVAELDTRVGRMGLVINGVHSATDGSGEGLPPAVEKAAHESGLELIATIPLDPLVAEYDAQGRPLAELPPEAPVRQAVARLAQRLDGPLTP